MLSESMTNKINPSPVEILQELLDFGYETVKSDDFITEILGENTEDIKQIAAKLNAQIREISMDEYRKVASPIRMKVTAVNNVNGTVSVNKPTDRNDSDCWTEVFNPTIFNHLEVGDEVLVGYHEGGQKSNCWIMFAITSDFQNKTILKDVNEIKDKLKEQDIELKRLNDEISYVKDLIEDFIKKEET